MAISSQLNSDGGVMTISVEGAFDFNSHKEFRDAYKQHSPDLQYIVDLSQTSRLDSSALGMLLLLREHAGGEQSNIKLQGCQKGVRKVLELSQFERLFQIE